MSDAGIAQDVAALVDKQAIREVTMRYFRGVDRLDAALIASAFHPDAIDEHAGMVLHGADIGERLIELITATSSMTIHHISTQLIELDGDRAGGETYYFSLRTFEHDGEVTLGQSSGRYVDRFERRDGVWKIIHRQLLIEVLTGAGALEPTTRARRSREDPSYEVLGALPH